MQNISVIEDNQPSSRKKSSDRMSTVNKSCDSKLIIKLVKKESNTGTNETPAFKDQPPYDDEKQFSFERKNSSTSEQSPQPLQKERRIFSREQNEDDTIAIDEQKKQDNSRKRLQFKVNQRRSNTLNQINDADSTENKNIKQNMSEEKKSSKDKSVNDTYNNMYSEPKVGTVSDKISTNDVHTLKNTGDLNNVDYEANSGKSPMRFDEDDHRQRQKIMSKKRRSELNVNRSSDKKTERDSKNQSKTKIVKFMSVSETSEKKEERQKDECYSEIQSEDLSVFESKQNSPYLNINYDRNLQMRGLPRVPQYSSYQEMLAKPKMVKSKNKK